MAKTISSPVEQWPGEIVLHDPLTLTQVAAWEEALYNLNSVKSMAGKHLKLLPAILVIVAEWHLQNFPERPTVENFPPKPHAARLQLFSFLLEEISGLYLDAAEIPND